MRNKIIKNKFTILMIVFVLYTEHVSSAQPLGGLTLTEVAPRVVTPNGDLLNDVIFFKFDDTLAGLPIESTVLDINGAKVSSLSLNSNQTALTWDGTDEEGKKLPSGVYVYFIRLGGNKVSGTVVVAE